LVVDEICFVGVGELLVCIEYFKWLFVSEGLLAVECKWVLLFLFCCVGFICGWVSVVEWDVVENVCCCWFVVVFVVCEVVV